MGGEWVFALAGTAIAAGGVFGLARYRGSANWPQVPGTVVEVAIEESRGGTDSGSNTIHYHPVLHYKYVIGGKVYRDRSSLGPSGTVRPDPAEFGRKYHPGRPLAVYADPLNPERNTLRPGAHRLLWLLVLFGLGFIALPFWVD